jgi:hypothetical protein
MLEIPEVSIRLDRVETYHPQIGDVVFLYVDTGKMPPHRAKEYMYLIRDDIKRVLPEGIQLVVMSVKNRIQVMSGDAIVV